MRVLGDTEALVALFVNIGCHYRKPYKQPRLAGTTISIYYITTTTTTTTSIRLQSGGSSGVCNTHGVLGGLGFLSFGNPMLAGPPFVPTSGFAPFVPPPTALLGPPNGTRGGPPPFAAAPFAPIIYWACPSPSVPPPHHPAVVIMQGTPPPAPYTAGYHEVANFLHSFSELSTEYLVPPTHQFGTLSITD